DRLAAQLRVVALLDRRVKRVHIDVNDLARSHGLTSYSKRRVLVVQFGPFPVSVMVPTRRSALEARCERRVFIELLPLCCCFSRSDILLAFASRIPRGESIRFWLPCGPFTLTSRALTAPIGTSFWRLDSRSASFIYLQRFWHGNWRAFRPRLWSVCG